MNYENPVEVLEALGITDQTERIVFMAVVISHFEAKYSGSMTPQQCDVLLKESVDVAKQFLEELKNEKTEESEKEANG